MRKLGVWYGGRTMHGWYDFPVFTTRVARCVFRVTTLSSVRGEEKR